MVITKDSKDSSVSPWCGTYTLNSVTFQDPNQKMLTVKGLGDREQMQFGGSMNGLFDVFQKNDKEFIL